MSRKYISIYFPHGSCQGSCGFMRDERFSFNTEAKLKIYICHKTDIYTCTLYISLVNSLHMHLRKKNLNCNFIFSLNCLKEKDSLNKFLCKFMNNRYICLYRHPTVSIFLHPFPWLG